MKLLKIINLILILSLLCISYILSKRLINDDKKKVKSILCYFDKKYRDRLFDKKVNRIYKRKGSNIFLSKLDETIYSSGIRKYLKYMTSEIFILGVIIMSFLFSVAVFKIYESVIFSVVAFAALPIILYGVLKEMVQVNFDRIDNSIMFLISSLKSNAAVKNNIVFMMEETTEKLKEPLRTYNNDFVRDIRVGMPMKKAFENYINKVENIRLRNILKNLYICSLNNADYCKLLDKTRVVIRNYYEEKEKRKSKVKSAQISITAIAFATLIILNALSKVTDNFYALLMNTTTGQVLVGYLLCVILFSIYRCLSLKKFNY
ncbi:tight adherence protein B [Clostridium acetobutylicum]|uniref:Predicted membrane protein n=1 Tax=Clostridium acetobutylicum (strain ATCC 824 / DSM 792 / JCM 1419 / IAM 19013 / LMG 5710 / NBRC 13948 / NRRL B-527 / VKM B-1787 / 2291 / W) TaxID=272562 RepID=Q97HN1_CLOAB|nr:MULTISPECIES: hypothetical protein [Clostridium]AAK79939.1 Predicted membrane protein [Clostridium acetobutylicum ATCC 824]ADZ21032.1 membrane protein [Clostridium acetobutylicum EA 2018]AEI32110.1 hypothetical protein SMB_G2011 [Clostridium acetobutylicum DSM 1731]AWV79629.1 hypothetical protein DK921_05845 [Clostridium acetobutylicum]MBC2394398.1 hypothetical protein [Clostridium acetobutylicum]